jgi:hypothetical protein
MRTVDELIPNGPGGYAKLDALAVDSFGNYVIDLDAIVTEHSEFDGSGYPQDHPVRIRIDWTAPIGQPREIEARVLDRDINPSALGPAVPERRWHLIRVINSPGQS